MIKHIVMWKLKNFAEAANKTENAQKMRSQLEGLKDKIKEIKHIEVVININDSDDSYDIVLCSEFENMENLEIYQNHSEHVRVSDFVSKVRLERRVVDYET